MKKIVILYHYDCPDGFGAAWAAWRKFGNKADYLAVRHQESPPKGLKNKELYFLDFTYFGKDLRQLLKENKVTIIDHHISAKREILNAPRHLFALNYSGAVLAWKFFHPKKRIPRLLRYIEERDLWKFKSPGAMATLKIVDLADFNFKQWSKIAEDLENAKIRKKYTAQGEIILKVEAKAIAKLMPKARLAKFAGHRTWVLNSALLKDEAGNALVKKGPPLAVIWRQEGKKVYISLRSDGKVDVSKLAQKYGGGGHRASAGFTYPAGKKLPWRYILSR